MGLLSEHYKTTGQKLPTVTPQGTKPTATGGGFLQQRGQTTIKQLAPVAPQPVPVAPKPSPTQFIQEKGKEFLKTTQQLDFGRIKAAFTAGAKSVPGTAKIAGGVIADTWTTQQRNMEAFFNTPVGKALSLTPVGLVTNVARPLTPVAEKYAPTLRESGQQSRTAAVKPYQQLGQAQGKTQAIAESVVFNLPQMAASTGLTIATAVVTRNPLAAAAVGVSTSYGLGASEVYSEARNNNLTDKQAMPLSMVGGGIIGAIDFVPLAKLIRKTGAIEPVKQTLIKQIAKNVVSAGTQAGFEGVTEGLQEIIGNAVEATYNKHKDLFEGVGLATVVGAVLGGAGDVSVGTAVGLGGKSKTPDQVVEEVNRRIEQALTKSPAKRTPEEKLLVDQLLTRDMSPDEALALVLNNGLEGTAEGRMLTKAASDAKQRNELVQLRSTEDRRIAGVSIVAPDQTYALRRQADELVEKATASNPQFKESVDSIAKELGLQSLHGPVKKAERIVEKAANDYGGDLSKVMDTNRSTILINTPEEYTTVLEKLRTGFPEIVREKNGLTQKTPGYKGAIINVRLADGTVAEVQLTTSEMQKAKEELGGHKLYEQVRIKKGDWQQAEVRMNKLYADAEAATLARLNSSSVISKPENNARTGANGLPSAVTPNTSSPSASTLTSTSSTSKNLGNGESDIKPPSPSIVAQNEPGVKETTVSRSQLPQGGGEEKTSRLEQRITKSLKQAEPDLVEQLGEATYQQLNKQETIKVAADYVTKNPDDALRVLQGEIEPPKGVLRNAIYVAMQNLAVGDVALARRLASLSSTRMGQELSILTEIDPHSPVKLMADIVKIREAAVRRRTNRSLAEAKADTIKKAKSYVKKPGRDDWDSFISSIQC